MAKRQHTNNHPRSTFLQRAQIRYAIEKSRWGLLDGSEFDEDYLYSDIQENNKLNDEIAEYDYQCFLLWAERYKLGIDKEDDIEELINEELEEDDIPF